MLPVILDFSHAVTEQPFLHDVQHSLVNCSDIPGTNCYCSTDAEDILRQRIASLPCLGIHFIDSGNYHYLSKLWLEKIDASFAPFDLILFDHHSDMQESQWGGLLSCGSWVRDVLHNNPHLGRVWLIGPPQADFEHIAFAQAAGRQTNSELPADKRTESKHTHLLGGFTRERVVFLDIAAVRRHGWTGLPRPSGNVYISVDKDALSPTEAATNWDQGDMTLAELMDWTLKLTRDANLLGVDICGEPEPHNGMFLRDKLQLNSRANHILLKFFHKFFTNIPENGE